MFRKILEIGGGVVVILLAIVGLSSFAGNKTADHLGNATASYVDAALGFYVNGTQIINSNGDLLSAGLNCTTATWNPASISSSTTGTSLDIALSGAVVGDLCIASLSSATSTAAHVVCDVNQAGTTTIKLFNNGATALDLATGTAETCIIH